MKVKKKKDALALLAVLTALLVLFVSGCEWAKELSDAFDEEKVLSTAKEAIAALGERDYQAIEDMVAEDFKSKINAKMLKESLDDTLKAIGKVDSYQDESAVSFDSKDYDGEIAVAVMAVMFENGLATITISFNTDYEIIGFYMK